MQSSRFDSHPWDRVAWVWLAIGAVLLPFAHFQTLWPIAAWLSPVFLMRFCRTQRLAVGLPLIVVAECIGIAIGLRNDYTTIPDALVLAGVVLFYALPFSLPFVVDRLLAARLPGVPRTVVYPLAAVRFGSLSRADLWQCPAHVRAQRARRACGRPDTRPHDLQLSAGRRHRAAATRNAPPCVPA
jgi:hypothetical protein